MSSIILKKESDILSRLSKNAKISLRNASLVAEHLKVKQISLEHLFVGIVLNEESLASKIVEEMGIDRNELLKESFGGKLIEITISTGQKRELAVSPEVKHIIRKAYDYSRRMSHVYVGSEHIMMAILESNHDYIKSLEKVGLTYRSFRKTFQNFAIYPLGILARPSVRISNMEEDSVVEMLGVNLVELAKEGKLDPVVGREEELKNLINILSRRKKNNPIIIGEAGVGKTVLVEGLAQKIADGLVPPSLRDFNIISLDISSIMAGSKMRGDVEEKVMSIVEEVISSKNKILFIDEIHNIIGSNYQGGSLDIASILKPALLQDGFRCIGATTMEDFSAYFEADNALARRFQPLVLEEATVADTVEILNNIKPILEKHHNVKIGEEAIKLSAILSDRYVNNRYLPDKAIDLLDEASAAKRLEIEEEFSDVSKLDDAVSEVEKKKEKEILNGNMAKAELLEMEKKKLMQKIERMEKRWSKKRLSKVNEIGAEDVRIVISKWTGIPVNTLGAKEISSLVKLEGQLGSKVIGQEEACKIVSSAIKRARTGISDTDRPWASFLFLGPTGVGKTELAKVLAQELFGNQDRLIQIDMSEMMEMHSVSKLIGSPPGYIGFQQGGWLTEKVRTNPHSVILFDEVEKAHQDVLNILLQILEYGHLTDGRGRRVNFKNTVIILTSNIGAEEIKKNKVLGFVGKDTEKSDEEIDKAYSSMKTQLLLELKNTLRPELLNRIDDIVIFRSLTRKDARKIVKLLIKELNGRLAQERVTVTLDSKAITHIVKEGFSEEYGARPIKRVLQDTVENAVANYLLGKGNVGNGLKSMEIKVGMKDNRVSVLNK